MVSARRSGKPASELRLRVLFTSAGRRVSVAARPAGSGRYRVRAVLRAAGRWRYDVRRGRTSLGRGSLRVAPSPPVSRLPGVAAFRVCAGAGPFWPTMTVAVDGGAVWVACKENGKLQRVDAPTGAVRATIALPGSTPIAVAAGVGSIWVLDSSPGTLYRINPVTNRVAARSVLGVARPYNLWIGAGSLWSVDDGAGEVLRIDPATLQVAARIPVGDGADRPRVPGRRLLGDQPPRPEAPEDRHADVDRQDARVRPGRRAGADGVGRGVALDHRPRHGSPPGRSGDRRSRRHGRARPGRGNRRDRARRSPWVPARASEAAQSGLPRLAAVLRVDATSRAVTTIATASGRMDVHGLADGGPVVWLADNTNGVLYPLRG